MNFLVDAQLPRRLVHRLREAGHDALHTLDLPDGNRTTDAAIIARADAEDRVVITKDADFVNAFLLMASQSVSWSLLPGTSRILSLKHCWYHIFLQLLPRLRPIPMSN